MMECVSRTGDWEKGRPSECPTYQALQGEPSKQNTIERHMLLPSLLVFLLPPIRWMVER